MNLELPFDVPAAPELDEYLARIDRELDALFLEAVAEALERIAAESPPAAAAGTVA